VSASLQTFTTIAMAFAIWALSAKLGLAQQPAGAYRVQSNNHSARIEAGKDGQWLFVDENGKRDTARIAPDGTFRPWGNLGRLLPNGNIEWPGNMWLKHRSEYRVQIGGGAARVEPENNGKWLLTNGHQRPQIVDVRADGTFTAWNATGKFLPDGTIEWPGNHWVDAKTLNMTLSISRFLCEGTTEFGRVDHGTGAASEDEIYLMIAGKKTGGDTIVRRVPPTHWEMSPPSQIARGRRPVLFPGKHAPPNTLLWRDTLAPGQSIELTIFVLEEDRQDDPIGNPFDLAQEAARATDPDDPTVIGTNHNLDSLLRDRIWRKANGLIPDSDDCPGAVGVRLENNEGHLDVKWSVREQFRWGDRPRAEDRGEENGLHHFELRGDGSRYQLWLKSAAN
jgi:hypothetical protein